MAINSVIGCYLFHLYYSSSVLLCLSKALSSAVTISSFQQDLCLRMLSCGRADIIPRALEVLGPEKINAINVQVWT